MKCTVEITDYPEACITLVEPGVLIENTLDYTDANIVVIRPGFDEAILPLVT